MSKINKSWEQTRDEVHSPEGIADIKREVTHGLIKLYSGIAESMWEWSGMDHDLLQTSMRMSRDTIPEKVLYKNGECCVFEYSGQIYMLPVVYNTGINLYGYASSWSPMPVGYVKGINDRDYTPFDNILKLKLNGENSVIIRNDLYGTGDSGMVEKMVHMLVDNILTANQLQLLASSPIVFNVTPDNLLSAKEFFHDIAERRPSIYINSLGEKVMPVTENLGITVDPGVFEIFDRFECNLLSYLGVPCVPITKREQQSKTEVQSNREMITVRRNEKLKQRQQAAERINAMFGTSLSVECAIDRIQKEIADEGKEVKEDVDDTADVR